MLSEKLLKQLSAKPIEERQALIALIKLALQSQSLLESDQTKHQVLDAFRRLLERLRHDF